MRQSLRILIALAIFSAFSWVGCAPIASLPVEFTIPSRPVLETCPADPGVQGVVTEKRTVEMSVQDAIKLKLYIQGLLVCEKVNRILTDGHIDKLENRLRVFGGK